MLCTIHIFYLYVFHQCLNISLTHFGYNLIDCLEIWKLYCRRVCESPVAPNRNVTASLSRTGIAARNLLSLLTIFGPTKFLNSSKSASSIRVNFLYRPLISWHFKSPNKPVPLYADLFLYNSVCHQRLYRHFLLLGNMWCTNMSPRQLPAKTSPHQEQRDHSAQPVRQNVRRLVRT